MRIFFLILFCLSLLNGCGKKSDPRYQVKISKQIILISWLMENLKMAV